MSKHRKKLKKRLKAAGINPEPLTNYTIDRMEEEGMIPTRTQLKKAKKRKGLRGKINKRTKNINRIIAGI